MRLPKAFTTLTCLCCLLASTAIAAGPAMENEHMAKEAEQKSKVALDNLSTLSADLGKPSVAVLVHVKDAGSDAADRLADIGQAFRDALIKQLQGPIAVIDAPEMADTSLTALGEAAPRKALADQQIDEIVLIDLHLQHDGTMAGSLDWYDVRDTTVPPARICSQQVAQAWDLRDKGAYNNFRYNVPMLSQQLVAMVVPTYITNRQQHQTVSFDVLGSPDVQLIDGIAQFLAKQPGVHGKVVAVQRTDPKAAGQMIAHFRVQGTVDVLSAASALSQWLRGQPSTHVDVLGLSPIRALLSVYSRPPWFELTDAKGDPSLRKRLAEMPIFRERAAIMVDPSESVDGRTFRLDPNARESTLAGGVRVATLVGEMGDAIHKATGTFIMDPQFEGANIGEMVQKTAKFHGDGGVLELLGKQRRFEYAWVFHLYGADKNTLSADLALQDLRSGTQIAFTSWNGSADDEPGPYAVKPSQAASVARYLTGKTLMKLLDRPNRSELMLVSVKGCTADEMFGIAQALQHGKPDLLEVRDATFDYGLGRFNVCYDASDARAIQDLMQQVAKTSDLLVDSTDTGFIDLLKRNGGKPPIEMVTNPAPSTVAFVQNPNPNPVNPNPVNPNPNPVNPPPHPPVVVDPPKPPVAVVDPPITKHVNGWAVVIGVDADCYGTNSLLSSADGTACFRQMLGDTCQFNRQHVLTLLKGLGDLSTQPTRDNIRVSLGFKGLGQAHADDLAVFCYSGHVRQAGDTWLLIPSDATVIATAETDVPIKDLLAHLRRDVAARDKVLMLDCYLTANEKAPPADLIKYVTQEASDMSVLVVCHPADPPRGEKTLANLIQDLLHDGARAIPTTVAELAERLKQKVTAPEHAFIAPPSAAKATLVAAAG